MRKPRSHRRNRQREAQKEMTERSESFRQRVEKDQHQRDRRQPEAERVDPPSGCEKPTRTGHEQHDGGTTRNEPVTLGGSRISLIDLRVDDRVTGMFDETEEPKAAPDAK